MRRALLLSFAGVAIFACDTTSTDTPEDGDAGQQGAGQEDAAQHDAAQQDATQQDAARQDATQGDGASSQDAAQDGGDALSDGSAAVLVSDAPPEGSVGSWCSTQSSLTFCDDFDLGVFAAHWDALSTAWGGTASSSSAQSTSAPNAFLGTTPVGAVSAVAYAKKTFARSWTTLQLDFDINAAVAGRAGVVQLALDDSELDLTIRSCLGGACSGAPLAAQFGDCPIEGSVGECSELVGMPASTWTHIRLSIDSTAYTATLMVGTSQHLVPASIGPPTTLTLSMGLPGAQNFGVGASTVYIDNVALWLN
jgi:hypothetical protein